MLASKLVARCAGSDALARALEYVLVVAVIGVVGFVCSTRMELRLQELVGVVGGKLVRVLLRG